MAQGEMSDLRPCPYCGGDATAHAGEHSFVDVSIQCNLCCATGGLFDDFDTVEANHADAQRHWNMRVTPSEEA